MPNWPERDWERERDKNYEEKNWLGIGGQELVQEVASGSTFVEVCDSDPHLPSEAVIFFCLRRYYTVLTNELNACKKYK